jgi:hypothetical protein
VWRQEPSRVCGNRQGYAAKARYVFRTLLRIIPALLLLQITGWRYESGAKIAKMRGKNQKRRRADMKSDC